MKSTVKHPSRSIRVTERDKHEIDQEIASNPHDLAIQTLVGAAVHMWRTSSPAHRRRKLIEYRQAIARGDASQTERNGRNGRKAVARG